MRTDLCFRGNRWNLHFNMIAKTLQFLFILPYHLHCVERVAKQISRIIKIQKYTIKMTLMAMSRNLNRIVKLLLSKDIAPIMFLVTNESATYYPGNCQVQYGKAEPQWPRPWSNFSMLQVWAFLISRFSITVPVPNFRGNTIFPWNLARAQWKNTQFHLVATGLSVFLHSWRGTNVGSKPTLK